MKTFINALILALLYLVAPGMASAGMVPSGMGQPAESLKYQYPKVTVAAGQFLAGAHQGTTVGNLGSVPASSALYFTDPRVKVVGSDTTGYRLVASGTTASAGTISGLVVGPGIGATPANLTVGAAAAKSPNGYYFACNRCRTPVNNTAVPAGDEYRIDVVTFYSPPWPTNHFRIALPGHYTSTSGTLGEFAASNTIHVDGVTLWYRSGASTWNQAPTATQVAGSSTWDIAPGPGVLTDDQSFSSQVPANSFMQVRIASHVDAGGSMISNVIPNIIAGGIEGSAWASTSQASQLTAATKPTGTSGVLSGTIYTPSFIVAKPTSGFTHSVLHFGDSKTYNKNFDEAWPQTKYLSGSFAAQAYDDDVNSTRWSYFIMSVPSNGIPNFAPLATAMPYKLGLLHLVPNCPYDIVDDDNYNNGGLDANYRSTFSNWLGQELAETQYWGNATAPLYKFRVIPKVNSWATNLAGQNPLSDGLASNGYRWQLDADLAAGNVFTELTGTIPTNDYYAYDQGANRDKVAVPTNTYTLASAYTASSLSISLTTAPSVGESLVLDPTQSAGRGYVRAVTGTGPYTVTLGSGVNISTLAAGAVVPTTNVGDNAGLHPSNTGHALIAKDVILNWKAGISFGYDLPKLPANDNVTERAAA